MTTGGIQLILGCDTIACNSIFFWFSLSSELQCSTGPFDGIFGFSQGGAIGAVIASRPDLFPGLRFVIFAGAPDITDLHFPANTAHCRATSGQIPDILPSLKSLHFAGLADMIVPAKRSQMLASRFASPQYIEHEQGHCIPTKPHYILMMSTFLQSLQLPTGIAAASLSSPSESKRTEVTESIGQRKAKDIEG